MLPVRLPDICKLIDQVTPNEMRAVMDIKAFFAAAHLQGIELPEGLRDKAAEQG